ncbi:hypothetical protein I5M27_18100 [Adhaeribacter sp. BT258]|uniref:LPXTG-motif cell wall anchor domain-containing protein n=1 Tax=Adhaeribacter terrigena TaxID=2793070 RepID=A0ABS1C6B5_9BACT|nr:hypothetical protein [Adhaeribacter terrigena]MBK0404909.1 hypothetical protein [Adhaeribacter terrigena]
MKKLFAAFLIPFFAFTAVFAQQEIPVEKKDRNEYTFKMPDYITVQDFEFVSAITTDQPDVYIINIRALDAEKKQDANVKGKLLFEINGHMLPVDFTDGLGSAKVEIKGTDKITMRAVDSDITRTGTIAHPFNWSKIGGLVLALVALGAVVWFIQRKRKK